MKARSQITAEPPVTARRSALFMPAANERAMEKAAGIAADVLLFDLEDAVAPDMKIEARNRLSAALSARDYRQETVVRVNGLDTPWGADDLPCAAKLPVDAVLAPKISSVTQLREFVSALDAAGGSHLGVWIMVETPQAILAIDDIAAASDRLQVLIAGTNDLALESRIPLTAAREGFAYALSRCVMAARAAGLDVLDGVFNDIADHESFVAVCAQGRNLGFDGKSLIHPNQVNPANEIFGVSSEAAQEARELIEAWDTAQEQGLGVVVFRGRMIEALHAEEARRVLALAAAT